MVLNCTVFVKKNDWNVKQHTEAKQNVHENTI